MNKNMLSLFFYKLLFCALVIMHTGHAMHVEMSDMKKQGHTFQVHTLNVDGLLSTENKELLDTQYSPELVSAAFQKLALNQDEAYLSLVLYHKQQHKQPFHIHADKHMDAEQKNNVITVVPDSRRELLEQKCMIRLKSLLVQHEAKEVKNRELRVTQAENCMNGCGAVANCTIIAMILPFLASIYWLSGCQPKQ